MRPEQDQEASMLQTSTTKKPAAVPTREELLRRAEALVPILEERAAKAEELRRCPDETIQDYIDNDLFRICQPAPYGGFELGYDVLCEVSQTLARGCGSQGWVHMVLTDNILKLASYSKQAQDEVWGKDTTAKLSNCVTPVGKGRPVDGGVIWSGRHTFSSGVDHAQWVMAAGTIDHGDRKQECSVLVPKSDIKIIDDWHTMGLSGTGSNTFVIDEAFVPAHRILDKKASDAGNAPGAKLYAAPVFHMPRGGPSAASFACIAVGIAEGCLEAYYKYTRPRKSRGTPVGALAGTQITAATSAIEIEAAARLYLGVLREAMGVLERGEPFTKLRQVQGKRNVAYAAHLSMIAVQRLFNDAGGRVLYTDNDLQRKFRDVHAAAAHHSLNWLSAAQEYGRVVLDAKE
jgi:3-hydroxy-9,10-secoandrosta-1,3,5(10)-triene-9,17-dione monooxygenase